MKPVSGEKPPLHSSWTSQDCLSVSSMVLSTPAFAAALSSVNRLMRVPPCGTCQGQDKAVRDKNSPACVLPGKTGRRKNTLAWAGARLLERSRVHGGHRARGRGRRLRAEAGLEAQTAENEGKHVITPRQIMRFSQRFRDSRRTDFGLWRRFLPSRSAGFDIGPSSESYPSLESPLAASADAPVLQRAVSGAERAMAHRSRGRGATWDAATRSCSAG